MADKIKNVLFLCTGNSCRSIIAEALLNHLGQGRFRGFSAGSHPAGQVNRRALAALGRRGIDAPGARSKNWDGFAAAGAPVMDMVITVCDNAAGEVCPIWPGHPATGHWGIPDPAEFEGGDAATDAVFDETCRLLESRIRKFLALPLDGLDAAALRRRLNEIGESADAAGR
jgi:arsenate reductase